MQIIRCDGGCGTTWPQTPGQPVPPPLVELTVTRFTAAGLSDAEIEAWNNLLPANARRHHCLPCALGLLVSLTELAAPQLNHLHPTNATPARWAPKLVT